MTHPQIFYKYAAASTSLQVLETGRLRWSSPLLFNDLSEFQRMPRFNPAIAESYPLLPRILVDAACGEADIDANSLSKNSRLMLALICQLLASGVDKDELVAELALEAPNSDDRIADGLRAFFEAIDLETARVLCLTTEFDNEALWANYAEGHTGCVLGFRHLPHLDTPLVVAQRVEYSDMPPVVGSGLDFLLYGNTGKLLKRTLDAVCCSKKMAWSYEREWRVVSWRRENETGQYSDYKFLPEELESVTLGPRSNAKTEAEVRKLLHPYRQCSLFRLQVHHGIISRVKL